MPGQSSFAAVLDKYRKISFSERDKGDRFERLMQAYLLTDPQYSTQFKKVWIGQQSITSPRYILDLLLSVINVSVQTVDIVNELPKVKFE